MAPRLTADFWVRAYLARKTAVIATLRTLGATRRVIFLTYFLQIGALSLLGIGIGLALGAAVPILLGPLIRFEGFAFICR